MVRRRDDAPTSLGRSSALQKHRKRGRQMYDRDRPFIPDPGLVARPAVPKSKHKTILEWTENADKKKKLEMEVTTNKTPTANFTFVPVGNPELTNLCKEISREQGALVYIVSDTKERRADLSDHVHRLGYHFRSQIVEQALSKVKEPQSVEFSVKEPQRKSGKKSDPIPESQEEINKQADAAIRDLFPRIPNTDREMIVRHAFQRGAVFNGKPVVGLQEDLTLSRRVQLAVIAHIRHTHTRYDLLLRETSWQNARKTVESLCLDILVKWRGDEETGRDQLDEVLREIVVIDDSDDEEDEDEDNEDDEDGDEDDGEVEPASPDSVEDVTSEISKMVALPSPRSAIELQTSIVVETLQDNHNQIVNSSNQPMGIASRTRSKTNLGRRPKVKKIGRRNNRRLRAWQDALNRHQENTPIPKTPADQISRMDGRDMNGSPRIKQSHALSGQNTSTIHTPPQNIAYQAIYAIDDSRPRRLPTQSHTSQNMAGLLGTPRREQISMRPRSHNASSLEHNYIYEARPITERITPSNFARPEQSFAMPRNELRSQDVVLPSIEQAPDPLYEGTARPNPYESGRESQVTYQEALDDRRFLPTRSNVTYVDNLEESQPKRRRIVLADSSLHAPASSTGESYRRLVTRSNNEKPFLMAPPMGRVADIRVVEPPSNMRPMIDQRLNHPGHIHGFTDGRDRDTLGSMMSAREYTNIDRERHIIIDDDNTMVRVIGRAPAASHVYPATQQSTKAQLYRSQGPEEQPYYGSTRPIMSMYGSLQESTGTVDQNMSGHSIFQAPARPNQYPRIAETSSTSLSTFPSNPQSREMNTGLVSYPSLSRPAFENESRFSSNRNEPILVGTQSSRLFAQDYFEVDNRDRNVHQRKEEIRRVPEYYEVSRMEPHYIPIESRDRVRQVGPQYVPINSQDKVQRASRQIKTSASGSNGLTTHVRNVPSQGEVIVLSP